VEAEIQAPDERRPAAGLHRQRWGGERTGTRKEKRKEVNDMNEVNVNVGSASVGAKEVAPKGLELELTLMLKGLDSAVPDGTSLVVAGNSTTKADIKTELQKGLGLFQMVRDEARSLQVARQTRSQGLVAVRHYAKDLRAALQGFFGPRNPQLQQFGIKQRGGTRALSSAQFALKAAKAKATRALRHTMGARQKQSIRATGATLTLGGEAVSSSPAVPASPGSSGTKQQ
jgi:hypothetical protein